MNGLLPVRKGRPFPLFLLLLTGLCGWTPQEPIRVLLAGDSTVADKPVIDSPERGWGQSFRYFLDGGVELLNFARNGRSTKSFIDQRLWDTVLTRIRPGDYVMVQFGHNDQKVADSSRYAGPHGAYKTNLQRFVRDVRDRGGVPVLITPVNRRAFNADGALLDTHGEYPGVVREVARGEGVPLIDLHASSKTLFEGLGPEGTKSLFLWTRAGEFGPGSEPREDNTHFTQRGALAVAGLVAVGIRQLGLPLADHLRDVSEGTFPGQGKCVGLDCYFNAEWREEKDGTRTPFHYTWNDTANSGYSLLGGVVDKLGAALATVPDAPTPERLGLLDVYIIVDPDTPSETPEPHTIDSASIAVIARWVENGGTLVLLGNDRGNAEFTCWNNLAGRFGIRFREDSHHRVVGKEYSTGMCSDLPDHPIFRGVRKIFLKEVSSLALMPPATPLLMQDTLMLMATSRVGQGMVFALGDPWIYNEYFDHRRLPADCDNDRAAEQFVRWLLSWKTEDAGGGVKR